MTLAPLEKSIYYLYLGELLWNNKGFLLQFYPFLGRLVA